MEVIVGATVKHIMSGGITSTHTSLQKLEELEVKAEMATTEKQEKMAVMEDMAAQVVRGVMEVAVESREVLSLMI